MTHSVNRPLRSVHAKAFRWNLIAVAVASLTALGVALLPFGTSSSTDVNGVETTSSLSLLSNEGPSVLLVLALPVFLVAIPLLLRGDTAVQRARVSIAGLLGILVVLGAASIGVFFVPTLILMIMSIVARNTEDSAPFGEVGE